MPGISTMSTKLHQTCSCLVSMESPDYVLHESGTHFVHRLIDHKLLRPDSTGHEVKKKKLFGDFENGSISFYIH